MSPGLRTFLAANWKHLLVALVVAVIVGWLFRPVIVAREWGWIPVVFGAAAFFASRQFLFK